MWGIPYLDTETKSLVSNSGPVSDGFKSKHYKLLCKSWGRSYTGGAVVKVVLEQTSLEYRISIETEICLCTVGLLRWSNVFYVTLPFCLVDTMCVSCKCVSTLWSLAFQRWLFLWSIVIVIVLYINWMTKWKHVVHFLHVYKPGSNVPFRNVSFSLPDQENGLNSKWWTLYISNHY